MTTALESLKEKVKAIYCSGSPSDIGRDVDFLICGDEFDALDRVTRLHFLTWVSGFEAAWELAKTGKKWPE